MAFITFDYRCLQCGHEEERLVLKSEMDAQRCKHCNGQTARMPAATRTTFRYADTKLKD